MYKIIRDDNPSLSDTLAIHQGIMQYNASVFPDSVRQISIFIKDDNNNVVGGIICYLSPNSMYIESIWVDERIRKQKYGSKLMKMAEDEAIKHGCKISTVDTFGWQAEEFYLNNDYKRVGETKDHIFGYSRISLRKDLLNNPT